MDRFIKQLTKLKQIQPDQQWQSTTRGSLLRQFEEMNSVSHQPIFIYAFRPVTAFALTLIILFTLGGFLLPTVNRSFPGQTLYPVKLSLEKVSSVLIPKSTNRLAYQTSLLDRRFNELNYLLEQKKSSQQEQQLSALIYNLNKQISNLQINFSNLIPNNSLSIIHLAQLVEQQTLRYQQTIDNLETTILALSNYKTNFAFTKYSLERTNTQALSVLVDNLDQPASKIDSQELAQKIKQKLDYTLSFLPVADGRVSADRIKADLDAAQLSLAQGDFSMALIKLSAGQELLEQSMQLSIDGYDDELNNATSSATIEKQLLPVEIIDSDFDIDLTSSIF
ncbi:MAG: hypothetical protein KAS12_05710 [Candidatus Aenigmarchaeota archaeon]|nr:hypothetical protein [Candidatus Aenigmarchaeota archaeon]